MLNYWPRGGMVDTKDLKSLPYGSAGSSPAEATKFLYNYYVLHLLLLEQMILKKVQSFMINF